MRNMSKQIICITFFLLLTTYQYVFSDSLEYYPYKGKLSKESIGWRTNPLGVLDIHWAYKYGKQFKIYKTPDFDAPLLASCSKISDCKLNFFGVIKWSGVDEHLAFTDFDENELSPDEYDLFVQNANNYGEFIVTEQKSSWYKIIYDVKNNKEGWIYIEDKDIFYKNTDFKLVTFEKDEDNICQYPYAYFFDIDTDSEDYLTIRGKPEEKSKKVTIVNPGDTLYVLESGKKGQNGEWCKVQLLRDDCVCTNRKGCGITDFDWNKYIPQKDPPICPIGFVRWKTDNGEILMWYDSPEGGC